LDIIRESLKTPTDWSSTFCDKIQLRTHWQQSHASSSQYDSYFSMPKLHCEYGRKIVTCIAMPMRHSKTGLHPKCE